jgi:quinol monooxygenase YgiN
MFYCINEIWESEDDFNNQNTSKHVSDFFQAECLDETDSAEKWNVNTFR